MVSVVVVVFAALRAWRRHGVVHHATAIPVERPFYGAGKTVKLPTSARSVELLKRDGLYFVGT